MATVNIKTRTPNARSGSALKALYGKIAAEALSTGDILRFPEVHSRNLVNGQLIIGGATPTTINLVAPELSSPIEITAASGGKSPEISYAFVMTDAHGRGASPLQFVCNFGS